MGVETISIFAAGDYESQIQRAQEVLLAGHLVVLPTETVYGAAGVLSHPEARRKLQALRGDGPAKPFTVHLARPSDAYAFIDRVGELGDRLMKKLWPGPVALVFEVPAERRRAAAAKLGVSESDLYDETGITLRCPDHIVAADVIGSVTGPVVLTAAGAAAGAPWSPARAAEELQGKVDLILDAGPTKYSKPSTILKVEPNRYEIVRQGVYDERIIERLLRTTILFVCSGNTCRSPMAEAITRQLLSEKLAVSGSDLEKKGISVISAGSFALPGARATPQAVQALKAIGADLSHHRSRPLTVELIHQADMIYTMSRNHAQAVMALVPGATEKVATLDPAGDIEDPIGGDVTLYQDLAGQLRELIDKRLREKVLT